MNSKQEKLLLAKVIEFGENQINEIKKYESVFGCDRIYGNWAVRIGGVMLDDDASKDDAKINDYVIDPSVPTDFIVFEGFAGALHFMYEQLLENDDVVLEEGRNIDTHHSDHSHAGRWRYITTSRYWDFYPYHVSVCMGSQAEYEHIRDRMQEYIQK